MALDFTEVTDPDDRVALIATLPLTDNETWIPLPMDTVTMFVDGVCQQA